MNQYEKYVLIKLTTDWTLAQAITRWLKQNVSTADHCMFVHYWELDLSRHLAERIASLSTRSQELIDIRYISPSVGSLEFIYYLQNCR